MESLKLTNIFDNECCCSQLKPLWGFSCFIEMEDRNILFDTGSNGRVLLKNISSKNLDIASIDDIFISHSHWDHIGGLDTVLEINPKAKIVLTSQVSKNLIRDLKGLSGGVKIVGEHPTQIAKDIYSTGMIGRYGEHSMVLDTDFGLVVIAGCAHGGVENILKRAREILDKPIFLAIGGFHLHNSSDSEIIETIEKIESLGTEFVSPSHCTGERARELFRERFRDNYIDGGLGVNISFSKNGVVTNF